MKTVLILGAGLTRAAHPKNGLKKRPPLDADFFDIARLVDQKLTDEVLECLTSLVGDYAKVLSSSFETASTYLYIKAIDSKPGSTYHLGFLNLLTLLNLVLAETTNSLKTNPQSLIYRFLLSELKKQDLKKHSDFSIITFNYDLLLERALEAIDLNGHSGTFHFPGCYRLEGITNISSIESAAQFNSQSLDHEGVALFKLHGSMNWHSKHNLATPMPKTMFNPEREIHLHNSPIIFKDLVWKPNQRRVYMKPVIVPPASGKRGMIHQDLLGLWSKAAKALAQADRVVIAGYSCPPLDLEARILLSENLRANPNKRVYVIDPSPQTAARFTELCGVDLITIYKSIEAWVRDKRP